MRIAIYVLLDVDGRRRYVGKSVNPKGRIRGHRCFGRKWAVSFEIIEECDDDNWQDREKYWIAYGRASGWPLENKADGGNAPSPSTVALIASKLRGSHRPDSVKAKLSVANTGRPVSEETRARLSAAVRAALEKPEYREKLRAARRGKTPNAGKKHSIEARARMSAAGRGKRKSPEHRAKLAEICRRNGRSGQVLRDGDGRFVGSDAPKERS